MKAGSFIRRNEGTSMAVYAVMVSLFLCVCASVADIGMVVVEKSRFQNALDSAALAAAMEMPDINRAENTARDYIEKNGYDRNDITISFEAGNTEIHIQGHKEMKYFFARIMNFDSIVLRPKAAASAGWMGACFNYALFSGSTYQAMIINGGGSTITGSTHTNSNFILHGGRITITGSCEAVGSITITGNDVIIGELVPGAPYEDMPDFTEIIKEQAANCGNYYNSNKVYDNNVTVTSSIYVNGEININSSRFSGTGCILAKNSIVFNGSSLYSSPEDAICFYSENGNIIFNGSDSEIHGIIYAPNGTVIFNGSNQTVYGRVIAKNIIFNGSGLTIESSDSDLKSLPSKGTRLIQ